MSVTCRGYPSPLLLTLPHIDRSHDACDKGYAPSSLCLGHTQTARERVSTLIFDVESFDLSRSRGVAGSEDAVRESRNHGGNELGRARRAGCRRLSPSLCSWRASERSTKRRPCIPGADPVETRRPHEESCNGTAASCNAAQPGVFRCTYHEMSAGQLQE